MNKAPVIPVLTIEDAATALPLAQALVAGGLPVLEVTLRTDAALAAIRTLADTLPEAIVGAGTVTVARDIEAAQDAGAQFLVSPGWSAALVEAAGNHRLPLLPGVATAGEIMAARAAGLRHLKFFPARAMGGTDSLQAFAGPFADVRFCPTGGIGADNAADYLALGNVLCVGGSWVAPKDAIAAGDWPRIEALAKAASMLK